jgi:hypothetical protein
MLPSAHAIVAAALVTVATAGAAPAVSAQTAVPDPVAIVLTNLERALASGNRDTFAALFASGVAEVGIRIYANDLLRPGVVEAVVKERERAPLEGVPPGDGFRTVADLFVATSGRGRVLTVGIDIRRPAGGDLNSWRIVGFESLSSVDGLYKLRLNTATQFAARNLVVRSEDLELALEDGTVFQVECDEGVTGLVLFGRGVMRFAPNPAAERGQLKIFAGSETLAAAFETAFVRMSPSDFARRVVKDGLAEQPLDPRLLRRAQSVFARESAKSFSVDLREMTRGTWHLLPPVDDIVAEVDTDRFDWLTFSRSSAQAEDVSLFQRDERRTIALYPSVAKIAARGRFYTDDATRDYDVVDYNVDVSVMPERLHLEGRTRLAMRVRSTSLTNVMLRLADSLTVRSVTSVEYGPLLHLRVRSQNAVLVSLPHVVTQDSELTLIVTYDGPVESQALDVDTVAVEPDPQESPSALGVVEPHMLLSNRVVWYPQNPVSDYATGTLRVTVPTGYRAIASGALVPSSNVVSLRDLLTQPGGTSFVFRADQPLRYMAVAVARFVRVDERSVIVNTARPGTDIESVAMAVETHPRLQARGRQVAVQAQNILTFFSSVLGEAPFTAMTIGLVEAETPGGHSPGYFALLNEPLPNPNMTWRGDPASFDNFPDFFVAHELAHQWWGQAVGWNNYHEQWISEGFAQYFTALWAQKSRGDRVFLDMLRQFRRWSLSESDQGPIHLGYRLGHIKRDLRVYRALVYNKGALVLHMLRRLVGDDVFFRGLQRFYDDRRFQKAGTNDFERAMEQESGRTLDRFFERWIYGTAIPRVTYRSTVAGNQVRLRFEQPADQVFDLPVTVTITGQDGRTRDVVVELSEAVVEQTIPNDGPVRQVQVNRDSAALAEFDGR